MGFMRKDYVSERFVIITGEDEKFKDPKKSPFAPGNEAMTKPAVLSLVAKDGILQRLQDSEGECVEGWSIRVFENADPIVTTDPENAYSEYPHYKEPAYGYHYTLIASPDYRDTLATLSVEQWTNILIVIQDRLRWLYTQKGVTYVAVYASHDSEQSMKKEYPRIDIATFSLIPPVIEAEAKSSHQILSERGTCPVCHMIESESSSKRHVLNTEGFVAFCPWASVHEYEYWICPRKHTTSFSKITHKEISDLALMIRATLGGLASTANGESYGIAFHLSPEKKNSRQIHWHVEVYPTVKKWTGPEHGYGIYLNSVAPEDAAQKLGTACRKEIANLVGIV